VGDTLVVARGKTTVDRIVKGITPTTICLGYLSGNPAVLMEYDYTVGAIKESEPSITSIAVAIAEQFLNGNTSLVREKLLVLPIRWIPAITLLVRAYLKDDRASGAHLMWDDYCEELAK
jgi:hypothetical protein